MILYDNMIMPKGFAIITSESDEARNSKAAAANMKKLNAMRVYLLLSHYLARQKLRL